MAVAWDGAARAVLVVADTAKPTSAEAVTRLRQLGLTPWRSHDLGHTNATWLEDGGVPSR